MPRKLLLYIAMSLDGYIAKHDDNIDFLSAVEVPNEDYGYADHLNNVDTVIWGRRTFDKVKTLSSNFLHEDKIVYVISRTKTGTEGHVIYHDDVVKLVSVLKDQEGKDIYCDGGAEIILELLKHKMIDRIIVSVIPHLLGEGIRLFKDGAPEQDISLKRSISYPSGLVQLWYDITQKGNES